MRSTRKPFRGIDEIVDLELNCKSCGTRLYAPVQTARQAFATVQNGGMEEWLCWSAPMGTYNLFGKDGRKHMLNVHLTFTEPVIG